MSFMTRPLWDYECPQGYAKEEQNEWGKRKCIPEMPTGFGLTLKPNDDPKNRLEQYWVKPNRMADQQDIATEKNCPVGTFGYNGKCFQACPNGFTLFVEQKGTQQLLSCMSTCERGWHDLTWVNEINGGQDLQDEGMYQHIVSSNQWCFHPLPDDVTDEESPDSYSKLMAAIDVPYNLYVQRVLYKDTPSEEIAEQQRRRAEQGQTGNPLRTGRNEFKPDSYLLERRGIYAARQIFEIGEAELPQPCMAPNKIGDDGHCYKACLTGYELLGDTCYNVKLKCPARSREDPNNPWRCIPTPINVKYGASIAELLFYLVITALFVALTIKIIKSAIFK